VLMVLASTKVSLMSRRDFFYDGGISGVVVGRGAFRHCVLKEEGR
jgi:hypothetical protein